jgi:hypothetical protein
VLLKNRPHNPKALIVTGLFFMAAFNLWPRVMPQAAIGVDWSDGFRGFLMGIGLGLTLWGVTIQSRRRRAGG